MKFVHTADTHLGFEFLKGRFEDKQGRRRRAKWIYDNFVEVVRHAVEMEADLFIHSGDLFNKSYIPREHLDLLVEPFVHLSKAGIRTLIIPGNHEKSEFPFDLFHGLSNVFVFDRPKSLCFEWNGYKVGAAGFPFIRDHSRRTFHEALKETEYEDLRADFNILLTHQAFDGASVGPANFTFGAGRSDTVPRGTVPLDFEYIAAGHIHRCQILSHPLKPRLKIVYPGSVQRMSFAEMNEDKAFVIAEIIGDRVETRFMPLPTWEMEMVEIEAGGKTPGAVEYDIKRQLWRFKADTVVRFYLTGGRQKSDYPKIDFEDLRKEMPPILECQFMLKTDKGWVNGS